MNLPPETRSVLKDRAVWLVAGVLSVLLIVGSFAGAWMIGRAREDVVNGAVLGMRADLLERARSLEGALRSGRSGLEFLAVSPALAGLPEDLRGEDPTQVRFHRLEAQGTLLRYLEGHPEVERVVVQDGSGSPVLAVGRRASFPALIPVEAAAHPAAARLHATVPLGGGEGAVQADLNPSSLLLSLATGTGRTVLLDSEGRPLAGAPDAFRRVQELPADMVGRALSSPARVISHGGWVVGAVGVVPTAYEPSSSWVLTRAEHDEDLLAGLGPMAARYRSALLLNLATIGSAVGLALLALHLARRHRWSQAAALRENRLRALERRLHEADRLAVVGRMAAAVAHEVRNPLEGMRNWLSLAEEEAVAAGARQALAHTTRVREGIERLAGIVERVMTLARPDPERFVATDLNGVVRATLDLVRGTDPFQRLDLEADLAAALPPVRGDRVLLGQLLLNLLVNAKEAMPGGGRVRIRTSAQDSDVRLTVEDDGPGIPEDVLPRLLDPFVSGRGSTGLGLYVCDAVARAHGGFLHAENVPGSGARFTLQLPASGRDESPAAAAGGRTAGAVA